MKYLRNLSLIYLIKVFNFFGRGFYLKKKVFSSKNILQNNFPINKDFNFIQIGANDGISFDFLYDFVVQRNSKGLVVEPVKEYFEELCKNYNNFKKIAKVNKAVHPNQKTVCINKINPLAITKYPDWVKGIASLDADHHLKTGIATNDIIKESVASDSLMNILKENLKSFKVDYFQVDTEGFDFEVIKQLDFKFLKPSIIKYEQVNLSTEDKFDLENLLKKHKYYLFDELGDKLAIDLQRIHL